MNNKRPIFASKNIPVPTAPIINKGPEEFVKAIKRSASNLLQRPLLYNSLATFAPSWISRCYSHNKSESAGAWNIK